MHRSRRQQTDITHLLDGRELPKRFDASLEKGGMYLLDSLASTSPRGALHLQPPSNAFASCDGAGPRLGNLMA